MIISAIHKRDSHLAIHHQLLGAIKSVNLIKAKVHHLIHAIIISKVASIGIKLRQWMGEEKDGSLSKGTE